MEIIKTDIEGLFQLHFEDILNPEFLEKEVNMNLLITATEPQKNTFVSKMNDRFNDRVADFRLMAARIIQENSPMPTKKLADAIGDVSNVIYENIKRFNTLLNTKINTRCPIIY